MARVPIMWMSQSCFEQPNTTFLESALPGGLPVNPAVVPQEHAIPRVISKHLNMARVLQSWKDNLLASIAEDVDNMCSSLSVRCHLPSILA